MSYHAIQEVWEILIGHMFDNWLLCDSTNHFILNHFISFDRSHLSLRQLLLSSLILIHYSFLLKSFFAITSWLVSHFHITHFIFLISFSYYSFHITHFFCYRDICKCSTRQSLPSLDFVHTFLVSALCHFLKG